MGPRGASQTHSRQGTAIFLAILLHLLLLWMGANHQWLFPNWFHETPRPPSMPIDTIDPAKLAALKKQWSDTKKRSLLINRDQSPKENAPPPQDARFESDRNIRVEKESRARKTSPLARPGEGMTTNSAPLPAKTRESPPQTQPKPKYLLPLSRLGVKYRLPPPISPQPLPPLAQNPSAPGASIPGGPGSQWVDSPELPFSGQNVLNAQESIYYSFYARLYDAIAPIWQSQIQALSYRKKVAQGTYTTAIELILDSEGGLLGAEVLQSSTINEFDAVAQNAWRRINRFPNPPAGLITQKREVRTVWTFRVHVGPDFQLNYAPPERVNAE
jgi:TonB family protein